MKTIKILLLFILLFASCTPSSIDKSEKINATIRRELLLSEYQQYKTPLSAAYFNYISRRLINSSPKKIQNISELEIIVFATQSKIALSIGNGKIALSTGLILSLPNEAALAFVLSHEIAHSHLGHTAKLHNINRLSYKKRRKLELQADRWAIGLMALSAYDPRISVQTLSLLHRSPNSSFKHKDLYPSLKERIYQMQNLVKESGWTPPGTIDRRSFKKLKNEILS